MIGAKTDERRLIWFIESVSGVLFDENDEKGVSELSTTVLFKKEFKEDCLSCFHAFPRSCFFIFRGVKNVSDLFLNTDELYMAGLTTWDKFNEDEKEVDSITDELDVSADKYNFFSSNRRLKDVWNSVNKAESLICVALRCSDSKKLNFWRRWKIRESDSTRKGLAVAENEVDIAGIEKYISGRKTFQDTNKISEPKSIKV